ncbi:Conserved_hypothetical protein [Hexamita inflata]|uniref:Ankyrin repeat-containing protein n=1 Tax=Hexamita inflata TaxID=28002 RepID=A0AA86NA74_9EUKA|nr:Conserved hypothetical protein [Hexamita inflata]
MLRKLLCLQPSISDVIDAVRQDDVKFISQNINATKQPENRPTDPERAIHSGFYPVHYAVYYDQQQVLQVLLPLQWNVFTESETVLKLTTTNRNYHATSNLDVAMLAIIAQNYKTATSILSAYPDLLNHRDEMNQTHLMITVHQPLTFEGQKFIKDNDLMFQFPQTDYIGLIFMKRRIDHLKLLLGFLKRNSEFIDEFYLQMLKTYAGQTIIQMIDETKTHGKILKEFAVVVAQQAVKYVSNEAVVNTFFEIHNDIEVRNKDIKISEMERMLDDGEIHHGTVM